MASLGRPNAADSTNLLLRILEHPGLLAAVRDLPGAVLGKLIDRVGLEDAGELVALASSTQLEHIFDEDLWRADRAGEDETFRPDRFALWLRVMHEAGEGFLVQRLCELPQDLLALAVHRLVLVLDMDVVEEQLGWAGDEGEPIARALDDAVFEEWEEFRLIARERDAWEDVWNALVSLDRDHHDRLRAILGQCCAMSTEYISGQGGLYQVLTADEMLETDVAATRDDRRAGEGFVSPADARAFLELARRGDDGEKRDPITRAYFRGLTRTAREPGQRSARESTSTSTRGPGQELTSSPPVSDLAALLREAGVIQPAPAPRLAPGQGDSPRVAPLFEHAMADLRERDLTLFFERVREVGYLVNVWIAGGSHAGRRPRPVEALELVLRTCEAGLRAQSAPKRTTREAALAALARTRADLLFRRGFREAK
jgi:hypothetical protein